MQIELLELLRTAEIRHPSAIHSIEMRGRKIEDTTYVAGDLRVGLSGVAWWRTGEQRDFDVGYEFLFEDLFDGTLDARMLNDTFEEALEDFSVLPLAEADWARPDAQQIFCSGPLPDPVALYAAVEDHITATDCFRPIGDFLNCASSLRQFVGMTASSSYLLAHGPASICKIVTEELKMQDVPHNSIGGYGVGTDRTAVTGLWVRLNGSRFFCRNAFAVLPD